MSSSEQHDEARSATKVRDLPIGIQASGTRQESDSMGTIEVPAEHYWGAQTQRSLIHFSIGDDHMPKAVYHAYGYVKKAAAMVNAEAAEIFKEKSELISKGASAGVSRKMNSEFNLYICLAGIAQKLKLKVISE